MSAEVSQSSLKFAQLPGLVTRFLIEVGEWMALLLTGKWSGRNWKWRKADEFLSTCVEFEEPAGASQLSKDILERQPGWSLIWKLPAEGKSGQV